MCDSHAHMGSRRAHIGSRREEPCNLRAHLGSYRTDPGMQEPHPGRCEIHPGCGQPHPCEALGIVFCVETGSMSRVFCMDAGVCAARVASKAASS